MLVMTDMTDFNYVINKMTDVWLEQLNYILELIHEPNICIDELIPY